MKMFVLLYCLYCFVLSLLKKDRPKEKFTSIEFQTLCEKQQKLRKDINSLKDAEKRKTLKQERNRVQKQIKDLKQKENNRLLEEQIGEIEACKNDNRLFATMRILYRKHSSAGLVTWLFLSQILEIWLFSLLVGFKN